MFLQTISKNVWIYTVRENHDDGSWLNNLKICDRSNLFVFGAACLVLFTSTVTQRDSTWYSLNMFQQESALAVQGSRGALPSQGPSSLRVWAFQIKTTSRWLMRLALQTTGGSQLSLKMQGPSGFCSSIWSGSLSNGGELFHIFSLRCGRQSLRLVLLQFYYSWLIRDLNSKLRPSAPASTSTTRTGRPHVSMKRKT